MKKKYVKSKKIFKLFIFSCFVIISYLFSGCNNEGPATLTTINHSSTTLEKLTWRGTSFGNLSPGDTVTETVTGIDAQAPYDFYKGNTEYFTKEEITVQKGTSVTFIFTDATVVQTFK